MTPDEERHPAGGEPAATPARVLVVDDHAGVRRGVIRLIGTNPDFEVVGEAATGVEAVQLATTVGADLVLMDVSMPALDGVSATPQILALPRPPAVVLFTAWADRDRLAEALAAGACGYVLKDAPPAELFRSLRAGLAAPRRPAAPRPAAGVAHPHHDQVIAIGDRKGDHRWPVRVGAIAAAALLFGTAGAAAASQGRLPAPIQAAARAVGLPTPPTKLEDARHALVRLDTAIVGGNPPAIAAAADQLRQRVRSLDTSDQARLGAASALSIADKPPAPVADNRGGTRDPTGPAPVGPSRTGPGTTIAGSSGPTISGTPTTVAGRGGPGPSGGGAGGGRGGGGDGSGGSGSSEGSGSSDGSGGGGPSSHGH